MEYTDRDIVEQDQKGGYYSKHVSAMTAEKLHHKGDIAAELAHRDIEIDSLRSALAAEQQKRQEVEERLTNGECACRYDDTSVDHCAWQELGIALIEEKRRVTELEASLAATKTVLERIADWPVGEQSRLAKEALANLPARASQIQKVLEAAAKEYQKHNEPDSYWGSTKCDCPLCDAMRLNAI